VAQLIEHRRWREGLVMGALRAGPATLAELLPRAYADAPEAQWRWARRSLLAQLLAMEKRGEVGREAGAGGAWGRVGELVLARLGRRPPPVAGDHCSTTIFRVSTLRPTRRR